MMLPSLVLLCVASTAPDIDAWARGLMARAASSPTFVTLGHSREAASTSVELGAALPSVALGLGVDHGESAAALGKLDQSASNILATGASYLPFGGQLSGSLSTAFIPSAALGLNLTLTVDLLRDWGGRYTRLQRNSAVALAESQLRALRGQDETAIETLLGLALDACVQEDLRRRAEEVHLLVQSALELVVQRAKLGLARESDVLQFRANVLSVERGLSDTRAARDTLAQAFEVTFGVSIDLAQCPGVEVSPDKTADIILTIGGELLEQAPRLMSAQSQIRGLKNRVELSGLDVAPTLSAFARVTALGGVTRKDAPVFASAEAWSGTVGANLTWEFGNTPGKLRERLARENLAVATVQQQQTRLELQAQLVQISTEMRGLEATLGILEQQRTTQREIVRQQRTRYEIGGVTSFELTSSYQSLIQLETIPPTVTARWRKLYWRALSLLGRLRAQVG